MSDNNDSPLVDVSTAARICSLSRSAFYKFVKAGQAPTAIKIGRSARWRRQELLEWIAAGCPDLRLGKKRRRKE